MNQRKPAVIIPGPNSHALAKKISEVRDIPLAEVKLSEFSDKEEHAAILRSVRDCETFIVGSTCAPASVNLMYMLQLIRAAKNAFAGRIFAVLPYMGYMRADAKGRGREPITARLMLDLIQTAGAYGIITMELHARQIQGMSSIPLEQLYSSPVLRPWLEEHCDNQTVIVSPDAGGVERARMYAKWRNCKLAIIDKRRKEANVAEVMHLIGDVNGRDCVIVDDMIDTAGTLTEGAKALVKHGARSVRSLVTHGVLSGPALERITRCEALSGVIITNTIDGDWSNYPKVQVLDASHVFGHAIEQHVITNGSVSRLYN